MNACFAILFLLTVPAANWMIGNFGTCIHDGPCVVPVWPGVMAPSGVLMIGLALVLRDLVHERMGAFAAAALILLGGVLSAGVAPLPLVWASLWSFILSELADLAVYAPLRRRNLALAVGMSGLVGAVVDSVLFLLLAFGSLDFLAGQVIGKVWMTLLAAVVITYRRRSAA